MKYFVSLASPKILRLGIIKLTLASALDFSYLCRRMILRIYPQNPAEREIRRVVEALERDGVVVYPTDSVYAYGCSLRSARGLERLRQLSGKQTGELSIICDGISRAAEYAM